MSDQPERILITGFSQGGTTLLLSLFDGHSGLSVYPDEPGLMRPYQRWPGYRSGQHLMIDCLVGTPDPVHLGDLFWQAGDRPNLQSRTSPVVRAPDTVIHDLRRRLPDMVKRKRLRGLEEQLTTAEHERYFDRYYTLYLDRYAHAPATTLSELLNAYFAAHQAGLEEIGAEARHGRTQLIKQPISGMRALYHLNGLSQALGRPHIVFLERNPFARLLSNIKHKSRHTDAPARLRSRPRAFVFRAAKNAYDWALYCRLKKDLEKMPNLVVINYDRLASDTADAMHRLAAQLGLAFEDILLRTTKLGIDQQVVTNRTGAIGSASNTSVDRWRKELSPAEIGIQATLILAAHLYCRLRHRRTLSRAPNAPLQPVAD